MKESDLSKPITDYLIKNGYEVSCEVLDCDIIAKKDDEIIAIELKKNFNATLLIQATQRQKFADSVYVAIARPENFKRQINWKGMCHLLKRLEIGLLLISFIKSTPRVEIVFHPAQQMVRKNTKKRKAVLKELENRSGNYNEGGINRKKIITAYRESNIFIACCMEKYGELSIKKLKGFGTGDKTGNILRNDFYGWFEKVERGVYKLNNKGFDALKVYNNIAKIYYAELKKLSKI